MFEKFMSPVCNKYLERWQTITIWSGMVVPYCPKEAPMGARNSSAKIWGGRLHRMRSWQPWGRIHLHRWFVRASSRPAWQWRRLYRVQSRPTHSLVAKFLQHSIVACSTRILCCKGGTLWTKPRTGVCEPDVVAPKAYQSYVSSADLPSDSLRKN